jgi:hypothetical protein
MPSRSSAVATAATCASRLRCANKLLASTPHNSRETTSGNRSPRMPVIARPEAMAAASSRASVSMPRQRRSSNGSVGEFHALSHHVMSRPIQVTG